MTGRTITFGKYKGRSIPDIARQDPQYLLWAADNVPRFSLSEAERQACEAGATSRPPSRSSYNGPRNEKVNAVRDDTRSDEDMEETEDYYWGQG